MAPDNYTIRSLRARAVEVPMPRPLLTGGGQVSIAPLVLLDLETHQGITGRSYIFGYTPVTLKPLVALLDEVEKLIVNQPVSPLTLAEQLQGRFRLLGTQGLVGMAMAGWILPPGTSWPRRPSCRWCACWAGRSGRYRPITAVAWASAIRSICWPKPGT